MNIVTNIEKLSKPCTVQTFADSKEIASKMFTWLAMGSNRAIRDNCLGLAANQLGYDACVCLIRDNKKSNSFFALINPEIAVDPHINDRPIRQGLFEFESCLSIPGKSVEIVRWRSIIVQDEYSKQDHLSGKIDNPWITYENTMARVIQHEIDHLKGMLITDEFFNDNTPSLDYKYVSSR